MTRCRSDRNLPARPRFHPRMRFASAWAAATIALAVLCIAPGTAAQPVTEATAGGRHFPAAALRGSFMVLNTPDIQLDGRPDRLSPGARIYSAQHMLVMPASITGQNLLVNYTRDAAGLVREVWILSPTEAQVKRASVERPLLNFWPFAADTGPRDDGRTPFDQLPRYGQ